MEKMDEKKLGARLDTTISIRVNKDIKHQAQEVFNELGMDMSTAVNVFLRKAIEFKGFPFSVRLQDKKEEFNYISKE